MILVPEPARALERLFSRRRALLSALLFLDGDDRWGPKDPEARASVDARSHEASVEYQSNEVALTALAEEIRRDEPNAFRCWAEAHIQLLDAYLVQLGNDPAMRTERAVASDERTQWGEVVAGTRLFVKQNTYYVHIDRALHDALFALEGE